MELPGRAMALGSGVSGALEQVPHGSHVGRSATPGTIIRGGTRQPATGHRYSTRLLTGKTNLPTQTILIRYFAFTFPYKIDIYKGWTHWNYTSKLGLRICFDTKNPAVLDKERQWESSSGHKSTSFVPLQGKDRLKYFHVSDLPTILLKGIEIVSPTLSWTTSTAFYIRLPVTKFAHHRSEGHDENTNLGQYW